jgi:hypothetical protein
MSDPIDEHKVGDRWTHKAWPKGTPHAVVGTVLAGYVVWAERGGSNMRGMSTRFLHEGLGWMRASKEEGEL